MLMRQLLDNYARFKRDEIAIRDGQVTLTYGELDERVHGLAAALSAAGVGPGDRVAYASKNSFRYFEWYYACCEVGAIAVTVNYRWTASEISGYLSTIDPTVVIAERELLELVTETVVPGCPSVSVVVSFDVEAPPGSKGAEPADIAGVRTLDYETLLTQTPPTDFDPPPPDAPCIIASTSGTSGSYRGAVMSQRATWVAGLSWLGRLKLREPAKALIPLPLHFAGGSPNWHLGIFLGGETVIMREFSAERFLSAVAEHRPSFSVLVPTMLYDLLKLRGDALAEDLDSLEMIGTGGAPIDVNRLARLIEIVGPKFAAFYGMTEICATGTLLTPSDYMTPDGPDLTRLESVGSPYPGFSVRVLDTEGDDVPADAATVGEIVFEGPSLASGYWGIESHETFRDGRVYSGDMAVVQPGGMVRIIDRSKDVIVSGGVNIPSREVEETLQTHPAVDQVAVVGIPDERYGEAVCAFVVTHTTVRPDELEEWCRARMASYKRPRAYEFIDELPINSTGKILKRDLRTRLTPASA